MSAAVLAGYKLTEVGAIPQDWDYLPLDQLTDPSRPIGYGIVQTGKSVLNGVKCLRVVDIVKEGIDPENLITTTEEISKSYARTLLREGDLVIALRGKIGAVAVIDTVLSGANLTRGVALLSSSDAFHSHYLSQYLSSSSGKSAFERNLNGSALQEMPIASLRKMCAVVPPIAEQRAIAAALSDVDALLAKQGQLIAKKQGLKQAAMQQLLTGQTRLPGFSGDWEVKKLGDISKITRGASPRPIDNPIWFDEAASVGWVRISDVTKSGMFLIETTQHLSALGIKSSRPVNRGSLIMSICATVGRPVITEIETCIHDGFVVFDRLQVNQLFLYYALKFIEDDWSKHGQTGSQMNLNTALINRTVIAVPDAIDEQAAIATILSDIDTEIAALEERQTKTRALKQGMMQELLTGKTRLV
jgi:type I restriction enzyme, S subunit